MIKLAPVETSKLDVRVWVCVWRYRPPCETLPPNTDRRINTDEDEEGSALQAIQDPFVPDVRGDPTLGPAGCSEV